MTSPSQPLSPLRIQKDASTSPVKMGSSIPRPLSELAPTEKRRNSPSFNQTTKKMALNLDSSPFQSSPFNASEGNSSPRLFWQGRNPTTPNRFKSENSVFGARETSPSPTRRTSIERLQKASRVKNSTMFAREQKQEYDPASVPIVERPLAKPVQGNAYGGSGLEGLRSAEKSWPLGHQRNDSMGNLSLHSPKKTPSKTGPGGVWPPSKDQISPTKSSLSSKPYNPKSSYDSEHGARSEESDDERELPPGRYLHGHAKSVTFDAAPPQVNEYEMATPDLSSVGTISRENSYDSGEEDEDYDGYNRGDSVDQDDSFDASLEDTDKTPVVGPEDWRHASPETHGNGIVSGIFENPFGGPEGSPMPDARPPSPIGRPVAMRTDSMNSTSDHRPLPPLPSMSGHGRSSSAASNGLTAAAERASSFPRSLPSPPPASTTKSEIQGMGGSRMPLEERLRLMMLQDDGKPNSIAEQQRERRMRRAGARERSSQTPEREHSINIHEDEDTVDELPDLGTYQLPPRISRESILRKVNGSDAFGRDSDYNFSSPMPSSSPERPQVLDPDTPIPSTEDASMLDDGHADESVVIKREPDEEDFDVYSIPEMYQPTEDEGNMENSNVIEEASLKLTPLSLNTQLTTASEDESQPTPRPESSQYQDPIKEGNALSVPELPCFLEDTAFGESLQSYLTPSPPPPPPKGSEELQGLKMSQAQEYLQRPETPENRYLNSKPEYDGTGWGPEEDEYEEGTPDSVIRHPIAAASSPPRDSPSIPEQVATIKASGSKLKTRPSATPADLMAMRELRRNVSGEQKSIPPIPERHRSRPSLVMSEDQINKLHGAIERNSSLKKRSLTLDIGADLGLGLDKDFDRVIEAQKVAFHPSFLTKAHHKTDNGQASDNVETLQLGFFANITPRKQRGYLMRHNTKLVVASSGIENEDDFHGTRSAGNSPVKKDRPQSWTVEPWNGQQRKNTVRDRANPRKRPQAGPAPPMPGQDSNVAGLAILNEEQATVEAPTEEGERGRLFVKVVGVKDLDLPLPKNEQSWFSLTLDNGVHCVTTAWLELGKNAPIGQEFELVVPNELEFQLTLNAKLVKPAPKRAESPVKIPKLHKASTFSRVFASPKKRKELEAKQKEEEQRIAQQKHLDAQSKRLSSQPTTWDLLSPLAADDGSFGRSYICLKDHENRCYGRPYVVEVACFNEWATEEAGYESSVKSKRGNTHVRRRAPYRVGKLELQLLFVPKARGSTDDDIPKSMNSCIREMRDAETALARNWEGHLSQQGGDCPYWRRRFFKLQGSKLTAFHESTRQPRATINLANASKLIDDRRALTQKETSGKGGRRRKSGFAEEEEGYMFVEEGFRIRFNNGEVIDFYADTAADKEGWMKVLDACIGKEGDASKSRWCDLVLKREEALKRRAAEQQGPRKSSGGRHHNRTKSMIL